MKITELSSDSLGVTALIGAAGAVNELLGERNVDIAVIDGQPGTWAASTLVVMAKRSTSLPFLAVTVETKPKLLRIEPSADPEPVADVNHEIGPAAGHLVDGSCVCTARCCNSPEGDCICPECRDRYHNHTGRR